MPRRLPIWGVRVWPWLVTIGAAALVVFVWKGSFSAAALDPHGGYYQRLASAILDGHLHLPDQPPSWLLHAPNPYDPATSAPVRSYGIHDSILFNGQYFYYWGPGTVVAFIVPLRAVGLHLTETGAGLAGLLALIWCGIDLGAVLQARFRIASPLACLLGATLALPFAGVILAQRIGIWEGNTLAAAALGAVAVQLFTRTALGMTRYPRALVVVAAVLGFLAMTTRTELVVVLGIPMVMWAIRRFRRQAAPRYLVLVPITALAAGVLALGLYNALRFGSFADFGTSHVLGGYDHSRLIFSSLAYVPPNLYYYLLQPLVISATYPFLAFNEFPWPWDVPGTYITAEPVAGVLWTAPWLVIAVAAVAVMVGRRRTRPAPEGSSSPSPGGNQHEVAIPASALAAVLVVLGLIQVVVVSGAIFGATERYLLAPSLLLCSGAAIWVASRLGGQRGPAAVVVGTGLVATLVLALAAMASGYFPRPGGPSNGMTQAVAMTVHTALKGTGFPNDFRWVELTVAVRRGRAPASGIGWTGVQAYGPTDPVGYGRLQITEAPPRRFSDLAIVPAWASDRRPAGRCVLSRDSGALQSEGRLIVSRQADGPWALRCRPQAGGWTTTPKRGDEILIAVAPMGSNG